jgi:hypothetical protein
MSISSAMDTAASVLLTFPDPINPSISRLRNYPTVITTNNYSSAEYGPYFLMGISIYVFFFAYVVFMGLTLRYHHLNQTQINHDSTKSKLIAAVQMWRECHKPEFYWIEVPMTLRRFLFSFCSQLLVSNSARISTLTTLLIISLTALIQFKWHESEDDNFLEIFLLLNAVIFFSFSNAKTDTFEFVSGLCVISGILVFLIVLARQYQLRRQFKSYVAYCRCCHETTTLDLIGHDRSDNMEMISNSDDTELTIIANSYTSLES